MKKSTLIKLRNQLIKHPDYKHSNHVVSYINKNDSDMMFCTELDDVFDTGSSVDTLENLADSPEDHKLDLKDAHKMETSKCNWWHTGAVPVKPKELIAFLGEKIKTMPTSKERNAKMNPKDLKKFSKAVSKRDAGKVIAHIVDTLEGNIKYAKQSIETCTKGINGSNRDKWNAACHFDKKKWLFKNIGKSNELLNQYLKETVRSAKHSIAVWSKYKPSTLVFNWGTWYGKPLNARGVKEMKYRLHHTKNFVSPDYDGYDNIHGLNF